MPSARAPHIDIRAAAASMSSGCGKRHMVMQVSRPVGVTAPEGEQFDQAEQHLVHGPGQLQIPVDEVM